MISNLSGSEVIFIAVVGVIPTLAWLWFWLKEDDKRPEPTSNLLIVFVVGAISVLPTLYLQRFANNVLPLGLFLVLVWASIEEAFKYLSAYFAGLRRKAYDEPIDTMVYLATAALGFATFENILFLIKSFAIGGDVSLGILTASMRFIGATLLHVLSSSVLGGIIALAFCKDKNTRILYTVLGLVVASVLHTLFNFFIISGTVNGEGNVLPVFAVTWVGVVVLLLFFEKVKSIVCKLKDVEPRAVLETEVNKPINY